MLICRSDEKEDKSHRQSVAKKNTEPRKKSVIMQKALARTEIFLLKIELKFTKIILKILMNTDFVTLSDFQRQRVSVSVCECECERFF